MLRLRPPFRRESFWLSKRTRGLKRAAVIVLKGEEGASLLEFAIVLPLLVVFVVGIYDFSAAFGVKQKVEQAAQEGAIVAGAQPIGDIQSANISPDSLQPVVTAVFNSLAASGVLTHANLGSCKIPAPPGWVPAPPTSPALKWIYTIHGCSSAYSTDDLVISIDRGWSAGASPVALGTVVTVKYPYHWRFGSVIQLLFPGPNGYSTPTQVTD